MKKLELDWYKNALNKKYEVTFEVYKGYEESIIGILLNYNSGNLDLYNEEKGELYHIPFSGLKWLLPVKDKKHKGELAWHKYYVERKYMSTKKTV